MRITRHIIRQDITYEGRTYDELCTRINRWKTLLLSRGAKKGDLIALAILDMNLTHISAIFAIAELGMKLLVIDKPVKYETLHMTKMALFGPVDFALECNIAAGYPWPVSYTHLTLPTN
jgi:acyl-coenzyme A synthetase/AMP-(fatty) acid ligase